MAAGEQNVVVLDAGKVRVADSICSQRSPHVEKTFAERPGISAHRKSGCAECFHV